MGINFYGDGVIEVRDPEVVNVLQNAGFDVGEPDKHGKRELRADDAGGAAYEALCEVCKGRKRVRQIDFWYETYGDDHALRTNAITGRHEVLSVEKTALTKDTRALALFTIRTCRRRGNLTAAQARLLRKELGLGR